MKRGTLRFERFTSNPASARPVLDLRLTASAKDVGADVIRRIAEALRSGTGDGIRVRRMGGGPSRNPTLVHHGIAQGAAWHVLSEHGAPFADLYFGNKGLARTVVQIIADHYGAPLVLAPNDSGGEYGRISEAESRRRSPLSQPGGPLESVRKRSNPSPGFGQVWARIGGGRSRVLSVAGARVQLLNLDSGNREWLTLTEFMATHRPPPNRNPKGRDYHRKAPAVGSYWQRQTYPQHLARVVFTQPAAGGMPPVVQLEIVTGSGVVMGTTSVPVNEFASTYAALEADSPYRKTLPNPSRSKSARTERAKSAALRRRLGRRTYRASLKALRRPARAGNAAQTLHYLEDSRRRARNPKRPDTVAEAAAAVIHAAGWAAIAKQVRHGQASPREGLEFVHGVEGRPEQRAILERALAALNRVPNPKRRIGGKLGLRPEDFQAVADSVLDTLAHHGKNRPIREAAKRELRRRGVPWSGEGVAERVMGREPKSNGKRRNPASDGFKVGDRVQLHAATDEWMQGDRYGVVVGLGRAREYTDRFSPGGTVMARPVRVKLDKSGRVRRFHPDNIFHIEDNPSGARIVYNRLLGGWYVVRGPHQTPISGRFDSKLDAQAWLSGRNRPNPKSGRISTQADADALALEAFGPIGRAWVTSGPVGDKLFHIGIELQHGRTAYGTGKTWSAAVAEARRKRFMSSRRRPNPSGRILSPGTRVSAVVYGEPRQGTVVEQRSAGIVWVRWDGAARKSWMHLDSLTVAETNPRVEYGGGVYVNVTASKREVADFKSRWPSSGLPSKAITFVFDTRTGDLVGHDMGLDSAEGTGALSALSSDMWKVAKARNERRTRNPRAYPGDWALQSHVARPGHEYQTPVTVGAITKRASWDTIHRTAAMLTRDLKDGVLGGNAVTAGRLPTRRNPRPFSGERERAEAMFEKWHEFPAETIKRVTVPSRQLPKYAVGLGKVVRIDYISNKWEGEPVTYTHSTKRPYPELVSDPDGRQLYLVGGRMKPTADGLVN